MSTERRRPRRRGEALHDATGGKLGEEPKPGAYPENDPRSRVRRKQRRP
ncbi:MAG TPA: hypothetical protein VJL54_08160 [Nitrososphaera sp.]|nr:hypothetical protein [Nitrososphaera sp.]